MCQGGVKLSNYQACSLSKLPELKASLSAQGFQMEDKEVLSILLGSHFGSLPYLPQFYVRD